MTDYLAFALIGLGVGAFYAALATGLVVTYRGTGVINFAAGAMGTWAVYVTDELRKTGDLVLPVLILPHRINLGDGWATVPSFAVGVASAALVGLMAHLAVFRPLRSAPALAKVIATVGVLLICQAMIVRNFGAEPRQVAGLLPADTISVGALQVPGDRLIIAAIATVIVAAMGMYFRYTTLGLATLAGAENERAIASARFSPQLLAGIAWVMASSATGAVLILASPFTVVNPAAFTLAIVPALAAVMLARLSSIGIALVAGFGLGSINAMITFSTIKPWWPEWARNGVTESAQFLILAIALFVLGRRLPERGAATPARLPRVFIPRNRPWVVAVVSGAGLLALALTTGSYRFGVITSMIMAIIALSVFVLTGMVGQISLAQAAFAGASGFVLSRLLTTTGLPFPIAPMMAALAAAGLGMIVGLPALRIRGVHLAVVTLGLAVAVEELVFRNPALIQGPGQPIGDPVLFGLDLGVREGRTIARIEFGLLVLVIVIAVFVAVANIARGSTGRRFLAVRSDEQAAAAVGVNVSATKLSAFALSSFLAGIGGVLLGYSRGQLSADSFTVFVGLSIVTFAYLGGITSMSGAMIAGTFAPLGIGFVVLERQLNLGGIYLLLSGVGLVLTAIFNPIGIAGANRELWDRIRTRAELAGQAAPPIAADPRREDGTKHSVERLRWPSDEVVLDISDVEVAYSGLRAVDGVSLNVRSGQIVGLIGANGAGKTTLLDAVGGFIAHRGRITMGGARLDSRQPHRRAEAGLARTWQAIQLFDDLSVADNLRIAVERKETHTALADMVHPASTKETTMRVAETLRLMGLQEVADRRVDELSLGRQKLVGLARAMAARPQVVLLDEPAAGLDESARGRLADRIVETVNDGASVLVVDHDMNFVFELCDYLYVMDFGRVIAAGTPSEIQDDQNVAAAYLGIG